MDKKRSWAVTMIGWSAMIMGVLGLLGNMSPKYYFAAMGTKPFAYIGYFFGIIFSTCTLASGVYILKLKAWARRLAVILCSVSIVFTLVQYNPKRSKMLSDNVYAMQEENIRQQYKPEYQEKALEKIRQAKEISDKMLPFLNFASAVLVVGFNLLIIYYFTRPKVKEQFS